MTTLNKAAHHDDDNMIAFADKASDDNGLPIMVRKACAVCTFGSEQV